MMRKYGDCIKECVEGICIYPSCIKSYIEAYREMWEDEDSCSIELFDEKEDKMF